MNVDEFLFFFRSDYAVVSTYLTPTATIVQEVPLLWIALAIAGGILILVFIVTACAKVSGI
jgi:hypothetical protein